MRLDREARSIVIVLLVSLAALTAGWTVRGAAIDPVRRVVADGVAMDLPADWLASTGSGDVTISARSLAPVLQRVQVGVMPFGEGDSLEDLATRRSAAHARQVDGYRVVGEGADEVQGRPAHAVSYAFLETGDSPLPIVVEGQAYFVRFGDRVVIAVMEADTSMFQDALDRFSNMMLSVEVEEAQQ